jgi:hypothetical protein
VRIGVRVGARVRVGGWGSVWGLGWAGFRVGFVITQKDIDMMSFFCFILSNATV